MGNCLRGGASPASSEEWAGDDAGDEHWVHSARTDSYERRRLSPYDVHVMGGAGNTSDIGGCPEKERLLGDNGSTPETKRQVKINITRRELEELLATGWLSFEDHNSRVLSAEQLLARLVPSAAADSNSAELLHGQGPWRPALQSIPEVE